VSIAALVSACGGSDSGTSTPTPTPTPAPTTLEQVQTLLAQVQSVYATATPTTGAARTAPLDGCFLQNGYTQQALASEVDTDATLFARSNAYQIGLQYSNAAVTAERSATNADGSARTEVDFTYETAYQDGTRVTSKATAVTGSTADLCATPSTGTRWRLLGNQKKVLFDLRARNSRFDNFKLADGTRTGWTLRREVQMLVVDKSNLATYAVVSGPGPAATDGTPFSWKMISPRLLRDDPAFVGKVGQANWLDTDPFRACWASNTAITTADKADCVNMTTSGNNWGYTLAGAADLTQAQVDAADAAFVAQGWQAGGTYTVQVFADDGWKTVNGQAGKTPIATYTTTLSALPYKFAELGNSDVTVIDQVAGTARYPGFDFGAIDPMAGAAILRGTTSQAATATIEPAKAPAGEATLGIASVYTFIQGTNTGATSSWPRTRMYADFYADPGASSVAVTIPAQPAGTKSTTYGEAGVSNHPPAKPGAFKL